MERGLGVLRVACGFGGVTAVEAYPPVHDQVVRCPVRHDLLQDSCPSLLIARCHLRVVSQLGEVLFDLPSCCLADCLQVEGLITSNPAAKRRGQGKRAGRSRDRGPEKVVTDPIGILLTAERAALLSGRDDEFVAVVLKGYTGMRWGEIAGLETEFARPGAVRVEWQLYELDTGELARCPPKDDS